MLEVAVKLCHHHNVIQDPDPGWFFFVWDCSGWRIKPSTFHVLGSALPLSCSHSPAHIFYSVTSVHLCASVLQDHGRQAKYLEDVNSGGGS